jgi:CRP-like cAMP-binding protein
MFTPFTAEELQFMLRFKSGELHADPGANLLEEGTSSPQLFTVLSGMGIRTKLLEDGSRQVVNFVFPGDFLGLQSAVMGESKHSVIASTPMRLCVFNRSDLWGMFSNHPARAYDLTWISAVEEHFLGETIATIGQRSATQRIAWAFLRIFERLRAVGMGDDISVPLPFRQQDLADALGLSIVHTNKTVGRLRKSQVANWTGRRLTVPDVAKLAELGLTETGGTSTRPLI